MAAPMAAAHFELLAKSKVHCIIKQLWLRFYSFNRGKKATVASQRVRFEDLFPENKRSKRPAQSQSKKKPSPLPHKNATALASALKFQHVISQRYREAQRSVVVRTQHPDKTLQQLSSYGPLSSAHFTSKDKLYILAEYKEEQSVAHLLSNTSLFVEMNQFPMQSRCLFNSSNHWNFTPRKGNQILPSVNEDDWRRDSATDFPFKDTLDSELVALCSQKSLSDLDIRMRFLICLMLEETLLSCLPEVRVIPYGSCLNGFGWWSSDLDMMLCFNNDPYSRETVRKPQSGKNTSSFKFLTQIFSTERQLAQRTLAMVASLLELMPRTSNVYKILNARVPIIRFKQTTFQLDCDISLEAMDSLKMTELLYLLSISDRRVKPLLSGIKEWAIGHKLTSSGEQQKFTTIGLISLLIHFLQTRSPSVLPSLRELQSLADFEDTFKIDGVVYGFPSRPHVLPKSENEESMEDLLHGFFTFYSKFDFANKAISLIEGATYPKPESASPVHIENPLCIGLNICQNVSELNLELFTDAMREAATKLETIASSSRDQEGSRLEILCSNGGHSAEGTSIQVSDLFDETIGDINTEADSLDEESEESLANNSDVEKTLRDNYHDSSDSSQDGADVGKR